MTENYFGKKNGDVTGLLENLHTNLAASIKEYEENGYPYDFYITSVSILNPLRYNAALTF